jgi:hypothetical protein
MNLLGIKGQNYQKFTVVYREMLSLYLPIVL